MARPRRPGGFAVADSDDGQPGLELLPAQVGVEADVVHWRRLIAGVVGALILVWVGAGALSIVATGGGGEGAGGGPIDPDSSSSLVVLSVGRLRLFDLATGTIEEHEYQAARVLVAGDHLILLDYRLSAGIVASSLTVVAADDLAGPPDGVGEPGRTIEARWDQIVAADGPHHLWIASNGGGTGPGAPGSGDPSHFQRIDLRTGVVVEERTIPGGRSPVHWTVGLSGSVDLLSSSAGGLYEYEGGGGDRGWSEGGDGDEGEDGGEGYRLVASGRLVVADGERALVEQCDDRLRCRLQWYERSGWEPMVGAVPPRGSVVRSLHGGRWLAYDEPDGRGRILDVDAGAQVEVELAAGSLDLGRAAISPDGEWLVHVGAHGRLVATRLPTGETTDLPEGLGVLRSATVAFLDHG